jgi:hypothetical protein
MDRAIWRCWIDRRRTHGVGAQRIRFDLKSTVASLYVRTYLGREHFLRNVRCHRVETAVNVTVVANTALDISVTSNRRFESLKRFESLILVEIPFIFPVTGNIGQRRVRARLHRPPVSSSESFLKSNKKSLKIKLDI